MSGMTPEEILRLLKEHGVGTGAWADTSEKVGQPALIQAQIEHATKLRDVLQGILDQKIRDKERLEERLARLRHGGGQ